MSGSLPAPASSPAGDTDVASGVTPTVGRLVVWRHGRTGWNAEGRFQGQLDPPLDATGRRQAARAATALAATLGPDALVVSSDLDRARATAQVLAGDRSARSLRIRNKEPEECRVAQAG